MTTDTSGVTPRPPEWIRQKLAFLPHASKKKKVGAYSKTGFTIRLFGLLWGAAQSRLSDNLLPVLPQPFPVHLPFARSILQT